MIANGKDAMTNNARNQRHTDRSGKTAPGRLLKPHPSNRYTVTQRVKRFDLSAIKRELLRNPDMNADFRTIDTPLPATVKTNFGVYDDGRRILIAVCLRDPKPPKFPGANMFDDLREKLELALNPWDDGIGCYYFILSSSGVETSRHFVPYDFARTTAFSHPRLDEVRWETADLSEQDRKDGHSRDRDRPGWVFLRLDAADLFRCGKSVGFNLGRNPGVDAELGTWNLSSGDYMNDASSLGRLYRTAPLDWARDLRIERETARLRIHGTSDSSGKLSFRLVDSLGETVRIRSSKSGTGWQVEAPFASPLAGRYRLYAEMDAGRPVEPRFVAFDIDDAGNRRPYSTGMTYDIRDDLNRAPYTPKSMAAELDLLKAHGIDRIHWIDRSPEILYSTHRPNPAFLQQTRKACGDLLPLAARLAKERGLRFIGVFKPFDHAQDNTRRGIDRDPPAEPGRNVVNMEGRNVWVPRAVAQNQDCVMSLNSDWLPAGAGTLPAGFRILSDTPLPLNLGVGEVRLWVSADNRRYTPYRGALTVRARRLRRPHQCWTAAGNVDEPSKRTVYALEITGLNLKFPYAAIEIKPDIRLTGRAHAFAEAWNAAGQDVPVTVATAGNRRQGFAYWQEWVSWRNRSPRMVEDLCWGPGTHGLIFERRRTQPALLEPSCAGARAIWLDEVQRILDAGVDGVCIRTLCHHNNVMDYLMMAFAPAVREAFRAAHGRDPEPTPADAIRIRELRGRDYTQFLRETKTRAAKAGKTLALHLEAGFEIPPAYDQRMQINLEWKTWIREKIADELVLKWWSAQNPFFQERVLPLARRHGIPVYIVDRNSSLKNTPRTVERAVALVNESRAAGFDGYLWYETASYKRLNPVDVPEFRWLSGDAIRAAARAAGMNGDPA